MNDWEYSDDDCPKCSSQLATRVCYGCGGEGYTEDEDEWLAKQAEVKRVSR